MPTCRELGIGLVAYSPLGRGFLTGRFQSDEAWEAGDFRASLPRFQPEHIGHNRLLVDVVTAIAARKSCTSAQISLAWLLAQGDDIVPILGTKKQHYLQENVGALAVQFDAQDVAELNEALSSIAIVGERYTAEGMKGVNA